MGAWGGFPQKCKITRILNKFLKLPWKGIFRALFAILQYPFLLQEQNRIRIPPAGPFSTFSCRPPPCPSMFISCNKKAASIAKLCYHSCVPSYHWIKIAFLRKIVSYVNNFVSIPYSAPTFGHLSLSAWKFLLRPCAPLSLGEWGESTPGPRGQSRDGTQPYFVPYTHAS